MTHQEGPLSYTFVSLYSGCGGMDLGFAQAGFMPVWANDIDPDAVDTYNRLSKVEDPRWLDAARRFEGHQAVCGDIRTVAHRLEPHMADLVIGGPPCQGFSVAGRMDPNDPRSKHVFDFLGVVASVKPKAFVMENVKALAANRRWADVIHALKERAGDTYDVELVVLNASHWGAPQARERMFLVGLPRSAGGLQLPEPPTKDAPPSVRSAFASLPPFGQPGNDSACTAKVTLAKTPVKRKSPFAGMLFNGQGRPMDLDRPAPTLPATMGGNRTPIADMDQIEGRDPWVVSYHRRVVIEGRPPLKALPAAARLRRLTVEEAAAIQTFPRDVQWQGRLSAKFRQIGNAVPPVLAFHVAQAVHAALERNEAT
jgi:DNA (cytosine-5)-methyltransferase 1